MRTLVNLDPQLPEKGWEHEAACREYDTELWFPTSYISPEGLAQSGLAITICSNCPVLRECLTTAIAREGNISEDRRAGIWGGTTPRERYNHAKSHQHHRRQRAAA